MLKIANCSVLEPEPTEQSNSSVLYPHAKRKSTRALNYPSRRPPPPTRAALSGSYKEHPSVLRFLEAEGLSLLFIICFCCWVEGALAVPPWMPLGHGTRSDVASLNGRGMTIGSSGMTTGSSFLGRPPHRRAPHKRERERDHRGGKLSHLLLGSTQEEALRQ